MQTEIEAKILEINKDTIRETLTSFGATKVFEERLFKRATFDNDLLRRQNAWVRLRDEGDKITLTLKQVGDPTVITSVKEVLFDVSNFDEAEEFLQVIGLNPKNYQENLREEWILDGVIFDIDTWPQIPTYVEIEADSEDTVKEWFVKLGYDYANAVFGSTDIVYKKFYNIDILKIPKLVF